MSVQKGTGLAWSLPNFSVSGTGVHAAAIVQSVTYTLGGDEAETRGADGAVRNLAFYNGREELTVECIPSGATLAAAKGNAILPARGADVTVADTDDTGSQFIGSGTDSGTGTYIFVGGTVNKRVDGAVSLTLNLRRYETHLATVAAS